MQSMTITSSILNDVDRINYLRQLVQRQSFNRDELEELAQLEANLENSLQISKHFAVYGSLAPGCANHFHLADIKGSWHVGFSVTGTLKSSGWGAALGFPGLIWSNTGDRHPVMLFESDYLPLHWERLDKLEGSGYSRLIVPITDGKKHIFANIYTLASSAVNP